jgi:hypothetical protein
VKGGHVGLAKADHIAVEGHHRVEIRSGKDRMAHAHVAGDEVRHAQRRYERGTSVRLSPWKNSSPLPQGSLVRNPLQHRAAPQLLSVVIGSTGRPAAPEYAPPAR